MKVVWTFEALQRLAEIEAFIAADSPKRAKRFVERLIKSGKSVALFPRRGRIVPELSIPEIREVFEKNDRIIYRIQKTNIEILTVFEGHRLLRRSEVLPRESKGD